MSFFVPGRPQMHNLARYRLIGVAAPAGAEAAPPEEPEAFDWWRLGPTVCGPRIVLG